MRVAVVVTNDHVIRVDLLDLTLALAQHHVAGIDRRPAFEAGADERRLRVDERYRLTLHVGAHEGAVRVVVLEERDKRGRHRDDLVRSDVHVVDFVRRDVLDLAALAANEHLLLEELALRVDRRVRLRDDVLVFLVGRQVVDLVGDPAVRYLPVRGFDETERVHASERRERADQADVRALRRLDRAHASVVRRVHVANLEAGPLTRQTAGAERRHAALVGEPGQRVRLVHELR